jgi:Flp pilus assembly pilin Flp
VWSSVRSLAGDEGGQDVLEYALLLATIALVGMAAWSAIRDALGVAYQGYEQGQQNLWEPTSPAGAGN